MDPLKILYSLPAVCLCGGVQHFLHVARLLQSRGHQVEIWAPMVRDVDRMFPEGYTVPIHQHHTLTGNLYTLPPEKHPVSFLRTMYQLTFGLSRLCREWPGDIDLIHAGFFPNVLAAAKSREHRKQPKVVHALHHPPEEILRSAYRRYWRLWKNAPLVADGILTVSRHTQDHIQALYGKDSYIVGNGLERDILNTPKDLSLRESLGWKPDQPVLVYVGSLTRRKGLEVLFEAFAGLKKRYPEALLAIVGGGYQPYFRSLATGFGLGEDIHWAGPVSRKRLIQYLDAATVFCFPSHSEGFGIPPLEAMARGVPVVLTDSGGVREYVRPAENCLMVATGDSGAFQIALEKILDQAALAQSLARQGQACAARFTWETVAEKTELAFEEILQKS